MALDLMADTLPLSYGDLNARDNIIVNLVNLSRLILACTYTYLWKNG